MKKQSLARKTEPVRSSEDKKPASTVVWGAAEAEDFLKVPRCLLRPGASSDLAKLNLKPNDLILLLALAERKFKEKHIRAYWEEIASDLGFKKDTVRKWAYSLRDRGIIKIRNHKGRDDQNKVGHRNERNTFDLSPFVKAVESAFSERRGARDAKRKASRDAKGNNNE